MSTPQEKMFSADGYIIDQSACTARFGRCCSVRNGCGWIAAYNVLRAAGCEKPWQTVRAELEKGLYLGGVLGTHPLWLTYYLKKQGLALRVSLVPKIAAVQAAKSKAGVVFYRVGAGFHFAAFVPAGGLRLRFLNAVYGREAHIETLRSFLKAHAKFGPLYCITVRPEKAPGKSALHGGAR